MASKCWSLLKKRLRELAAGRGWMGERINVTTRALSATEAIGRPAHDDYPLLKGKETIVEALFLGARGHAFTDLPGRFKGSIADIVALPLRDNRERAVFLAALNAVLRKAGQIERTVHCKDDAPVECAREIAEYVAGKFGSPKIFQVGYQPRIAAALAENFDLRITDLDADNAGRKVGAATVQAGAAARDNIKWCDIIVATGSAFANDTAQELIDSGKPVIFYGVTCAGAAHALGLTQFCPRCD